MLEKRSKNLKYLLLVSILGFTLCGIGIVLLVKDTGSKPPLKDIVPEPTRRIDEIASDFLKPAFKEEIFEAGTLKPNKEHLLEFIPNDNDSIENQMKKSEQKFESQRLASNEILAAGKEELEYLKPNVKNIAEIARLDQPIASSTPPLDHSRTITRGTWINLILYNDIISDVKGPVQAYVKNDVYSTDGTKKVLPAYTMVLGEFKPLENHGDRRLNVVFKEFITPQGSHIILTGESIAHDLQGRTGLSGIVDNRTGDKYKEAGIAASIVAGSQLAIPYNDERLRLGIYPLMKEMGNVSSEVLRQKLNIKPSIEIPSGTNISILLNETITLPEAHGGTLTAKTLKEQ
ncbi:MAG: TrbI/VirB10 family protein [Alphaproteobacteria bacterium]|mgnify:CR=1 FL=1|jgi:type IV secretory pathway VirB10-like protein|nr:TrbI/VirB10 family protein [Alphaproteobacteria bacterium]OJV12556.1 MAG: hypothetical protein BGO27_03430 [Alphaproteobacteria bacterium 33-17]